MSARKIFGDVVAMFGLASSDRPDLKFAPDAYPYRIFISYARADANMVDDLHGRLTKYRTPAALRNREGHYGAPPRRISVFLDRKSAEAGGGVAERFRRKLEQSAFLVVVCSRQSAESTAVNDEISIFLETAGIDRIIPVFLRDDRDTPLDEITPPALAAAGAGLPLGADLILDGGMGAVRDKIIGGVLGFAQDQIAREQEIDDRRAKRRSQAALASISTLFFLTAILASFSLQQRTQELSTQSGLYAIAAEQQLAEGTTDDGLLLSLEGARNGAGVLFDRPRNTAIYSQLVNAVHKNRVAYVHHSKNGQRTQTTLSVDGAIAAIMDFVSGEITVIDTASGNIVSTAPASVSQPIANQFSPEISPDGRQLLRITRAGIEIIDAASGKLFYTLEETADHQAAFFSADGSKIAAADPQSGAFRLWDALNGQEIQTIRGAFINFDLARSQAIIEQLQGFGSRWVVVDLNTGDTVAILNNNLPNFLTQTSYERPNTREAVDTDVALRQEPITEAPTEQGSTTQRSIFNAGFGNSGKVGNLWPPADTDQQDAQAIQLSAAAQNGVVIAGESVIEYLHDQSLVNLQGTGFTVWDISRQERAATIAGNFLGVSPDGRFVGYVEPIHCELMIADINTNRSVRVREQATKNCAFTNLRQPPFTSNMMVFSPTADYALLFFNDGIFLQPLAPDNFGQDNLPTAIPLPHRDNERIINAGFDLDSVNAYTVLRDGGARIWDPVTGDDLGKVTGHVQRVDRHGKMMATLGNDRAVRIWDLGRKQLLASHKGAAYYSRDRQYALSIDQINVNRAAPYVFNVATNEILSTLRNVEGKITHANFAPDNSFLVTLSEGARYLQFWNVATGEQMLDANGRSKRILFNTPIALFSLFDDGASVVVVDQNGIWRKIDIETNRIIYFESRLSQYIITGESENFGLLMLTRNDGAETIVWDPQANDVVLGLPFSAQSFASNADNSVLAVASGNDIGIFKRDDADGRYNDVTEALVYMQHNAGLTSLRINRAGTKVLSASADNSAHLWDANTGEQLLVLREPEDDIWWAAFTHDESKIVTISPSGFARVWDAETGDEIISIPIEARTSNLNWYAFLVNDDTEIVVSGLKSTRKWAMPPEYRSARELVSAACDVKPDGATLDTPLARQRYGISKLKGENGDPCAHYGLLHYKYYQARWCSWTGYGCTTGR